MLTYYNLVCYNKLQGETMRIIKSKQFLKEYKKKIEYKHKKQVMDKMAKIESLIINGVGD